MEQNYEGLTFNIPDTFDLRQQWFEAKKLWNPRLCPLPPVTLNHLCNSSSAYARMFIATKLRVAFRAQASASQRCVTLRNLQFASNLWSQCTSRFDDFFYPLPVCVYLYANFLLCIYFSNSAYKHIFLKKQWKIFRQNNVYFWRFWLWISLSQKGSSHFGLKKLPDLASLWEGVELFSRKQGRISPRLKFLLYQYKSENCVTKFKSLSFEYKIQQDFAIFNKFFSLWQQIKIIPVFVSLKQKKRIFETCWYQCTVIVNVIRGSVLIVKLSKNPREICEKTIISIVLFEIFFCRTILRSSKNIS